MKSCLSLADISSNARVKEYLNLSVLQVANSPIFRKEGYGCKRAFDVPPKGQAVNPELSLKSALSRARTAVRDICLCNRFEYFFTWTLSPELLDRYDADVVGNKVKTFLRNASYRKGFRYVIVGERHADGAIHFHGLCNLGSVAIMRAVNPHTGEPLSTKRSQAIYNMVDWKWGFSTCVRIDENYEQTCNYLTKYLTKDYQKIFGKWYFSSRDLKKRPDVVVLDDLVDYDDFKESNPDAFEVNVFLDIKIAAVQQGRCCEA